MPGDDHSPLDQNTIGLLREDGSLLRELRDLFDTETRDQLDAMVHARARGQATPVSQAAHRLKGTAVTLGATEMQQLCIEIEQLANAGALNEIQAVIERLRTECDRVSCALDEALNVG